MCHLSSGLRCSLDLPGLFCGSSWNHRCRVSQELWQFGPASMCMCINTCTHTHTFMYACMYVDTRPLFSPFWRQISGGCTSGCVCPDGLVSDGAGGCINETSCPCVHSGQLYQPGDSLIVDCNTWCVRSVTRTHTDTRRHGKRSKND